MTILGICTVKNEADIIYQSLAHNAKYYDIIFATDNGSSDGSASEIERASSDFPNVVYLGPVGDKISKEVKWQVWEHFRSCFGMNDWWGIVDADEFVEPDLREVVAAATRELADHIYGKLAQFYYTESEVEDWMAGRETLEDRKRPIQERRRFYKINSYQPRLFRNVPWLRWTHTTNGPMNRCRESTRDLGYRHYQYRDVPQVQLRTETRTGKHVPEDHFKVNPHWKKRDWREVIVRGDALTEVTPNGSVRWTRPPGPPNPPDVLATGARFARAMASWMLKPQPKSELFGDVNASEIAQDALRHSQK